MTEHRSPSPSPASTTADPTTVPPFPRATVLGYPRIGPRRELKAALESHWAGTTSVDELEASAAELRQRTTARLVALGLGAADAAVPSSFSYYDQVLDVAALLGAVPDRFADLTDGSDLAGYFALARGDRTRPPLEMTKWFDTNYHYLVPEIGPLTPVRLVGDRPVRELLGTARRGVTGRPVLVGPVTFLLLAKAADDAPVGFHPLDRLTDVVTAYGDLLRALAAAGAPWVQLDEPALVTDGDVPRDRVLAAAATAYGALAGGLALPDRPALLVATPYGPAGDALPVLADAGVDAVAVDLVRGDVDAVVASLTGRFAGRSVVAGVVDGHNVWRTDLDAALGTLNRLADGLPDVRVCVGTSTSLLHVPHDVEEEMDLDPLIRSWLAFADQKVREVVTLAAAMTDGPGSVAATLDQARTTVASRRTAPGVERPDVRARVAALTDADHHRSPYPVRAAQQAAALPLPPLPTTTIGSFPQTPQIRRARAAHRRGDLTSTEYTAVMRTHIAEVVASQEELGLDVLVHGEAERNDMVQYFAELLEGFAVTQHGWVQSYGSRCTRPSVLWGDVVRPEPMTVPWTTYAASLTDRPLKGMLTGPVTILAWSFVRDDQPLADTARQVALALRDEATDLEAAGVGVIQVDEPALRELLPLRAVDRPAYLRWSVDAFRLATSGVADSTQVHTHLCYSEFGAVMEAIDALDADVTSIEAARSRMEVLDDVGRTGFSRGVGPGVYDIHSPRVPDVAEIEDLLERALRTVPADRLWVNPDCGLKTRRPQEVAAALRNLVAATATVRARL
ncbi:5-methyltetrahydropteroyltriglutamate--homocysteine S-methyltransferase [Actinotalea sp. K2]|uniref:5-methyltetrahydropteroyltriglutamate-- homocysteine S-methyltransferase n=1 Tax=Actinotalea sp. K2 TaxID=2939438 RepID=UPI002018032B|nr:5-methyltetrahydropteroyltriglutamate--homocysteine S-methyltransferase [Actinotalea sp. K2]MCL3862887.1 5-methyltetrahydropteroyltriglutamate--homocysteine S-methyltransferase [Actinotalea sp. K2]